MSPFESCRRLLEASSRTLHLGERIDLVFQDADLVPLLVHVRPQILNPGPALCPLGPCDGPVGCGAGAAARACGALHGLACASPLGADTLVHALVMAVWVVGGLHARDARPTCERRRIT